MHVQLGDFSVCVALPDSNIFMTFVHPHVPLSFFLFQLLSPSSCQSVFSVTADPALVQASAPGVNVSLVCASSARPILCLWKTPYGHIYTLSEGVFAESGRLREEWKEERAGLQDLIFLWNSN